MPEQRRLTIYQMMKLELTSTMKAWKQRVPSSVWSYWKPSTVCKAFVE